MYSGKKYGVRDGKYLLKTPGNVISETLNFKMSLDASALRNLCLWCEFQSCLPFIISLLLENFLTALPHSLNNIITENQTVSCSRSLSFLSFFSYWFLMFVWMFCCLRDMFDAGSQQQSKGKGSVGSHTARSVSLCQVLLKFRRVHLICTYLELSLCYTVIPFSILIEFSKHSIFLFLFASRLLAKKDP